MTSRLPSRRQWLRRADQAAVAALVGFALVAMAGYFVQQWRTAGGVIDVDHASPLTAEYRVDINSADLGDSRRPFKKNSSALAKSLFETAIWPASEYASTENALSFAAAFRMYSIARAWSEGRASK